MSWNGSDNEKVKVEGQGQQRSGKNSSVHLFSPPSPKFNYKALLAGLIVVIGGGLAAWLFMGERGETGENGERGEIKPSQIAEVKPAVVTNAAAGAEKGTWHPSQQSNEDRLALYEKIYGGKIPENLEPSVYFMKNPPQRKFTPLPRREDIFQHHSERTIAAVLLLEPGAFVMRRTTYDESFDDDFRKSLEEPTLLSKDDTPAERELKQAVNEAKAELAERMRNGEKPSDIMTSVMNDAYELGKYRESIKEMVREFDENPDKTDQEVDDFVAAANKMLEEKGAGKIEMPSFVRRQTRLRVLAKRAEEKKETEKQEEKK